MQQQSADCPRCGPVIFLPTSAATDNAGQFWYVGKCPKCGTFLTTRPKKQKLTRHDTPRSPFFGREYPGLKPDEFPGPLGFVKPSGESIEAGVEYYGPRGSYEIVGSKGRKLVAKYLSGEWEGQTVEMTPEMHLQIQHRREYEAEAKEIGELDYLEGVLNTFYDMYPALYMEQHVEDISTRVMAEKLETNYPAAWENAIHSYHGEFL